MKGVGKNGLKSSDVIYGRPLTATYLIVEIRDRRNIGSSVNVAVDNISRRGTLRPDSRWRRWCPGESRRFSVRTESRHFNTNLDFVAKAAGKIESLTLLIDIESNY